MPQFHVGGWNVQPLLAWWMGATVVLERTFDAGRVLHLIEDRAITTTMGVPGQLPDARRAPATSPTTDLSSLRARDRRRGADARAAAAHLAPPRRRAHPGLRADRGRPQRALPSGRGGHRPGRHGRHALPARRGRARRPGHRRGVEGSGTGELVVRGPNVFLGYFREPEEERPVRCARRAAHRRPRRAGRRRLLPHRRPAQGHLHQRRRERRARRDRERAARAPPRSPTPQRSGCPHERWGEVCAAYVVLRPGSPPTSRTCSRTARPGWRRSRCPAPAVRRGDPALVQQQDPAPRRSAQGSPPEPRSSGR